MGSTVSVLNNTDTPIGVQFGYSSVILDGFSRTSAILSMLTALGGGVALAFPPIDVILIIPSIYLGAVGLLTTGLSFVPNSEEQKCDVGQQVESPKYSLGLLVKAHITKARAITKEDGKHYIQVYGCDMDPISTGNTANSTWVHEAQWWVNKNEWRLEREIPLYLAGQETGKPTERSFFDQMATGGVTAGISSAVVGDAMSMGVQVQRIAHEYHQGDIQWDQLHAKASEIASSLGGECVAVAPRK